MIYYTSIRLQTRLYYQLFNYLEGKFFFHGRSIVSKMSLSPSLAYCSSGYSLFIKFRVYTMQVSRVSAYVARIFQRMMHDLETLGTRVQCRDIDPANLKETAFFNVVETNGPRYRPTYATPLSRTSRASSKSGARHPPINARFALRVKNSPRYNTRIDSFPFLIYFYFYSPLSRAIRDTDEKHLCLYIRSRCYILKTRLLPRYVTRERAIQEKRRAKRRPRVEGQYPMPDRRYIVIAYVASFVYNDPV